MTLCHDICGRAGTLWTQLLLNPWDQWTSWSFWQNVRILLVFGLVMDWSSSNMYMHLHTCSIMFGSVWCWLVEWFRLTLWIIWIVERLTNFIHLLYLNFVLDGSGIGGSKFEKQWLIDCIITFLYLSFLRWSNKNCYGTPSIKTTRLFEGKGLIPVTSIRIQLENQPFSCRRFWWATPPGCCPIASELGSHEDMESDPPAYQWVNRI